MPWILFSYLQHKMILNSFFFVKEHSSFNKDDYVHDINLLYMYKPYIDLSHPENKLLVNHFVWCKFPDDISLVNLTLNACQCCCYKLLPLQISYILPSYCLCAVLCIIVVVRCNKLNHICKTLLLKIFVKSKVFIMCNSLMKIFCNLYISSFSEIHII